MTDPSPPGTTVTGASVTGTDPYPWPYDAADGLRPDRLALVVDGAQARWASDATELLEHIDVVARTLRAEGVLVVFVRHARPSTTRRRRDDLPVEHSRAWELAWTPDPRDLVVDSPGCDGFLSGRLDFELRARGRDHLLFAGLASEVLVDSTLRSANDRGYECLTLRDLVHPFHPDTGERVLASVTMSGGIFGAVGSSDAVLAALAARPGVGTSIPTRPNATEPDSNVEVLT